MDNALPLFPQKRLKAADGLTMTGELWEEVQDYHRRSLAAHTVGLHGSGVVSGLQVMASRPPDNHLNVQPGVAVDQLGRVILVPKLQARDLDTLEGTLYLVLEFYESESRPPAAANIEGDSCYVEVQFKLQVTTALPDTPYVELARLQRRAYPTPITDARDPEQPGVNEIDRRFRRELVPQRPAPVFIGIVYLGDDAQTSGHASGLGNVARSLRTRNTLTTWVEQGIALKADLNRYTLLHLVAKNAFSLTLDEQDLLQRYLQRGGTIFCEACRQDTDGRDPAAHKSFLDLARTLRISLQEMPPLRNDLLDFPYLFGAPPGGFETKAKLFFAMNDGFMISNCDYGCLWQGKRRGVLPTRSELRDALEWGENLVHYALRRREQMSK
ncbi:MAG: DUF4159 domain-containing protein [Caldilineaceae bacterium]